MERSRISSRRKQHRAKRTLWEESTRVRLLIAGPGIQRGESCPEPASLIDIFPTLVELCQVPENTHLEGIWRTLKTNTHEKCDESDTRKIQRLLRVLLETEPETGWLP